MPVNLFNTNFYRAANADLASFNDAQALSHFQNHGLNEGRAFSPFVDLNFYRASNGDLTGFNNRQAFEHLQNYGVAEGRRFSPFVDLNFYRASNSDLASLNNQQILEHLQNYGVAEGRRFSQFMDISHYAAKNPDLVTAGLRNNQLLNHFEIYGLGEGRSFSLTFDVNYYQAVYSDLASARLNNRQLYEHFQLNGLVEGRASSQFFNISFYRSNNPDLANLNNYQAYQHFLIYGQQEGRRASGAYAITTTIGSATDWFTQNIRDAQLQTIARNRSNDGTLDRNDMLAIFRDAQDSSTIATDEITDLGTLVANNARFGMADYVRYLSGRVVDGAFANMSANTFESNLVSRWFLGTIAPTARFNNIPLAHTAVQGSLYGSIGRAVIGDIDQGSLGDCAFLAALGATFTRQSNDSGNARSSTIDSMIIDNGDNTYTIRFYSGGTAEYVTVDRRLPTLIGRLFGASANGSKDPKSTSNILWAPLVERAYAQWREGREGAPGYNLIGNGDNLVHPLQFVTGLTATSYSTSSLTFSTLETALGNGRAVQTGRLGLNTTYIIGRHAYSVTNAYTSNGQQRVVVRNPYGVDGLRLDGSNDGFIDVSYTDFVSNFNSGVVIA